MAEPTRGDRTNGTSARTGTQAQEEVQPNDSSERLPNTITAGGRSRVVSRHLRGRPHARITANGVAHALENWILRGVRIDEHGEESMCYIGPAPGIRGMIRVAISMDDEKIITAFADQRATRALKRGDDDYFDMVYGDWEKRNEH